MHLPSFNRYQRATLLVAAAVILAVQLAQFSDSGIEGSGWVLSLLAAFALILAALTSRSDASRPPLSDAVRNRPASDLTSGTSQSAELLSVEIEHRSAELADSLIAKKDEATHGLVHTVQGSRELGDRLVEAVDLHIRESCLWLMLGLVAMRRSKGNHLYIRGAEFSALQKQVGKQIMSLAVKSLTVAPLLPELRPDTISHALLNDLEAVRSTITRYCVTRREAQPLPESSLLEWFRARTGVDVREHPAVLSALSSYSLETGRRSN